MGRGRVQPRFRGELLQVDRGCVPGQRVQQAHHALDHLDRGLGGFLWHGKGLFMAWRAILYAEIGGDNRKTAGSSPHLVPDTRYSR
ncbi:hypothetical protein D3C83_71920 [compost metagenome]